MQLSCKLRCIMYKTEPRKKILDLFNKIEDASYSSTYLVEYFKDTINKSTIYRNLKSLEEEKIIHKTYNDQTKLYEYQLNNDCDHHFHLKCELCGRLIHLECDELEELGGHLKTEHGFVINPLRTVFYGVCTDCAGKMEKEDE